MILARDWAAGGAFDALVSADGDGDRPLVADETGRWLRGDIAGILCARQLGVRGLVTPVSSNTAVERCGAFTQVLRTRIGSPYVIEGMQQLRAQGLAPVAGYEANGGFLLETPIERAGRTLAALPTRDAVLVAVTILLSAAEQGKPVSALAQDLPARFTHSDRIKDFPTDLSQARIAALSSGDPTRTAPPARRCSPPSSARWPRSTTPTACASPSPAARSPTCARPATPPNCAPTPRPQAPQRAAQMNAICLDVLAGWRG